MLHCLSFHSVKGGVGKSTLATMCALAARKRARRVVLIDMDLTGTSLADVLELEAPDWPDAPKQRDFPGQFHSSEHTNALMEQREQDGPSAELRLLNDYLLYASPDWYREADLPWRAVAWRLAEDAGFAPADSETTDLETADLETADSEAADSSDVAELLVIPSSALPTDVQRTLPVIFDEEYSAYLEGRLEYLLAALAEEPGDTWVIFDVPPTIPGLSRAVISLGLRLGCGEKAPLAEDGMIPEPLVTTTIHWKAIIVTTPDRQDRAAVQRWTDMIRPNERGLFQVVINRALSKLDQQQLRGHWQHGRRPPVSIAASNYNDLLESGFIIAEDSRKKFFGEDEALPDATDDDINKLLKLVEGL